MKELITVIINVYNAEKFIKRCLDSVVNQTYKNLEILIINDGSTDNTLSICESYNDKRIRIINTNHIGISLARNIGFENAKGEYFYFIDVDDLMENDSIEYLYNLCKKYNTKISACKAMDIYDYNYEVNQADEEVSVISNREMEKKILLSIDRTGSLWNKLYKRELFDNIRCDDRVIYDVIIVTKLILKVDNIAYSNQIKYYYLRHSQSITGINRTERLIDLYKASNERYVYIKNIYNDFIENEIGLILLTMEIYFNNNKEVDKYFKENKVIKNTKKLFSFKILKSNISTKIKIKIILFMINSKLCRLVAKKYQNVKYKYKM